MRAHITDQLVEQHRSAGATDITLNATQQRGLLIRIGRFKTTWRLQVHVRGRTTDMAIGAWPAMKTDAALGEAAKIVSDLEQGRDPFPLAPPPDPTLGDVWDRVRGTYKPGTLHTDASFWRTELKRWADGERSGASARREHRPTICSGT